MPELILVTGGAGFIGSHLCEALLRRGDRVVCLDNFCDFYSPEAKRRNLSSCLKDPAFTLVEADITDRAALEDVFDRFKFDLIIHLAARAGVRPSIEQPELYSSVNLDGTLNLLQLCARHGPRRFIFASSSSVYGANSKLPFAESDPVDSPISPYAATKKAGELLCHAWHHLHNISMLCLRFFTVYGPRQRPDLAIRMFADLMIRDECVPIFGDGSSSRDYTYITDIVAGILSAADLTRERLCYEVVNLGGDHGVPLLEMLRALEKVSGLQARIQYLPPQAGDIPHTRADISKAKALLGFAPRTSFEEGLQAFWNWLQDQI